MMRFSGPPAMDRAPRPRPLPSRAALLAALERNPSAEAVIRFTVTSRGKVRNVAVQQSNDPAFAQLAKAFVEQMEFRPARAEGRSVACDVEMPFGRN
jgi:TonB family protein